MIDATARLEHYISHLAPTWLALPESERGTFWVTQALMPHAERLGIDATPYGGDVIPWEPSDDPILVAAIQDIRRAVHTGRPIAHQGHGIGQAFLERDGSRRRGYSGGAGFEGVRLFLAANERQARLWRAAYPGAETTVVGSPKLGGRAREDGPRGTLVVLAFHWRCFPGDTLVSGPPVVGATSRWFKGELVVIRTASGDELSCTPNHPVLTGSGWSAAGSLDVGDHLVRGGSGEGVVDGVGPDEQHVPARIEDVARAAIESRSMLAVGVPVAPEDFHGDGGGSDVAVVASQRLLLDDPSDATGAEPADELGLLRVDLDLPLLAGAGSLGEGGFSNGRSAGGRMGRSDQTLALRGTKTTPAPPLGGADGHVFPRLSEPSQDCIGGYAEALAYGAGALAGAVERDDEVDVGAWDRASGPGLLLERDAIGGAHGSHPLAHDLGLAAEDTDAAQVLGDLPPRLAEALDELEDGGPCDVALDEIVEVSRREFEGHVYNLQTVGSWYRANGFIVHNCAIGIPEAGTAWDLYRSSLRGLSQRFDLALHCHPRIRRNVRREAQRLGIPFIESFDEVLDRAAVYCNDASSTLYEFAAFGGPVVVLNDPRFRRGVEHGLRFWDCADVGVQVDGPTVLSAAIQRALQDPPEQSSRRREISAELYPTHDPAERAASALLALAGASEPVMAGAAEEAR